ncbi:hypothetical protein LV564_16690 [Komagataeibacter nataicola]|uniref:CdiI C-terminal domain-containing protein n=2 Tax=Komagataeibacter nataicola TaxID=265960 RepID=A0ABX5PC73_9PROT|nr:hypothetical protein [Komagataeibacter nataicola]PYD65822.1 hypothetical protein CDI09_11695 [Komagataeibacter nataicola]WEQ55674.1 hypothetical protein LV564_16690 [Komagataeibacter nataicola]GBR21833.1 hypothetical protein AA0616_2127 [Komagataeibacter nataicola NRIC 0616]
MNDECRFMLINRMEKSLVAGKHMPDMVFADEWDAYYFYPSDYLTEDETAEIIWSLMDLNGESLFCIVDMITLPEDETDSVSYININETKDKYKDYRSVWNQKRKDGLAWLHNVDAYALSSTSGKWFIYSERDNEIAIIALKGMETIKCFAEHKYLVHAILPDDLNRKEILVSPLDRLDPAWCENFRRFYSHPD